jgi:hypothetical protein
VVQCACDRLGGAEALAGRLGMSAPMVRAWLTGTLAPPPRLFFRIVDLLQEADADCVRKLPAAGNPAEKNPERL